MQQKALEKKQRAEALKHQQRAELERFEKERQERLAQAKLLQQPQKSTIKMETTKEEYIRIVAALVAYYDGSNEKMSTFILQLESLQSLTTATDEASSNNS